METSAPATRVYDGVLEQGPDQLAPAAAEVDHRSCAELSQGCQDGLTALGVERHSLLLGPGRLLVLGWLDRLLDLVTELGEPGERDPRQRSVPTQVALRDQGLFRVRRQPGAARAQQLVDLVGALPVVLRLVEHRQQYVELVERIGEPDLAGQPEPDIPGVAPLWEALVQRDRDRLDLPAQGFEEPMGQRGATTAGQHRDLDLQRDRGVGQILVRPASAAARRTEHVGEGHSQQGGGCVRSVVDVLREAEVWRVLCARPGQPDRVDVEKQRRRAPVLGRFGIEHDRGSERLLELLDPVGMLVQQVPEISGRSPVCEGCGDRQQHAGQSA